MLYQLFEIEVILPRYVIVDYLLHRPAPAVVGNEST